MGDDADWREVDGDEVRPREFPVGWAFFDSLTGEIRGSLPSASAEFLQQIAPCLLALERLPKAIDGLWFVLTISLRQGTDLEYADLRYEEGYRLQGGRGGSVYDPEVGSDSWSNTAFECSTSGLVEGDIQGWTRQAVELLRMGATVSVEGIEAAEDLPWEWDQ